MHSKMAKYDLSRVLLQYLDSHLVLAVLEFLAIKDIYNRVDLLKMRLEILNKTNMIDYAVETWKQLYPKKEIPEELRNRRQEVVNQLSNLQAENEKITSFLTNENVTKALENIRDPKSVVNYLSEKFDFKLEMMDNVCKLAKYRYECGDYQQPSILLHFYLMIMPSSDKNYASVMWGKLASEISAQNWDTALEDLNKLREFVDSNTYATPLQLLQQRTWLIHWSLFIFFNHIRGRDLLIDTFLYRPNYLNAIQTMCPHILRYLTAAVILNRGRRNALKDLVKVIQQESYTYKDPITEFIEHLYINFDFEKAREKLSECQTVLLNDFFLVGSVGDFVEQARLMIFETFCRIHQCISIPMLADKLNMKTEEAECWIVNLIRNAHLDAKLDSKLGHVVVDTQPASPYNQVVEKMDALAVRSEALQALIERKLKGRNQDMRWVMHDY